MTQDLPIPDFNDSLFTGMALSGLQRSLKTSKQAYAELIQDFYNNEFHGQFPEITRQRRDCQAIVIAAQRYRINFLNTCHVPFFTRQAKFIGVWRDLNKKDVSVKDIQWAINGWKPRGYEPPAFDQDTTRFICDQRDLLHNPTNVNEGWLKSTLIS